MTILSKTLFMIITFLPIVLTFLVIVKSKNLNVYQATLKLCVSIVYLPIIISMPLLAGSGWIAVMFLFFGIPTMLVLGISNIILLSTRGEIYDYYFFEVILYAYIIYFLTVRDCGDANCSYGFEKMLGTEILSQNSNYGVSAFDPMPNVMFSIFLAGSVLLLLRLLTRRSRLHFDRD